MEEEEREKTGIRNLKVKYNKVFGYYLEVTNAYKELVPDYYTRKQTLANAERFITPRLKSWKIQSSVQKISCMRLNILCIVKCATELHPKCFVSRKTAKAVAKIDVFTSLALVAERNNYVRPKINEKGLIHIKGGRHPVVVENDTGQYVYRK